MSVPMRLLSGEPISVAVSTRWTSPLPSTCSVICLRDLWFIFLFVSWLGVAMISFRSCGVPVRQALLPLHRVLAQLSESCHLGCETVRNMFSGSRTRGQARGYRLRPSLLRISSSSLQWQYIIFMLDSDSYLFLSVVDWFRGSSYLGIDLLVSVFLSHRVLSAWPDARMLVELRVTGTKVLHVWQRLPEASTRRSSPRKGREQRQR
jgi:hypothetical protein